jgi:hypothetical protein
LEPAVAGEKADPSYVSYQVMDVPPGEYLVEIYAYFQSQTMRVAIDDDRDEYDEEDLEGDEEFVEVEKKYRDYDGAPYVIRLTPLAGEPPLPAVGSGWFENFEFREGLNIEN